jgi:hypothetical protein
LQLLVRGQLREIPENGWTTTNIIVSGRWKDVTCARASERSLLERRIPFVRVVVRNWPDKVVTNRVSTIVARLACRPVDGRI